MPPPGPSVLPASTPGARGASPASSPRVRGPERREVPGGCPATPPPAGACPQRAWWRGAGQKDGGREARPPRVLPAEATRRTLRARRGPARAHSWPVAASPAAALRPAQPALLPDQPSAEPDQQEVWRTRAAWPPEVWRTRCRRAAARGKPQSLTWAPRLSAQPRCRGVWLASRILMLLKDPNGER